MDPATLDSPFIRGLYDLVFAYEGGHRNRPRFSAGLGLFLAGRLFFDFEGSIFWKMQAGMGEVVFAPLYQVLHARGVEVRLYHRLDELVLDADATSVDRDPPRPPSRRPPEPEPRRVSGGRAVSRASMRHMPTAPRRG